VIQGTLNVAESASGDFDGNTTTNGSDFLAWQRGFGTVAPNGTRDSGDADGDQDVDGDDLDVWGQQYGTAANSSTKTLTADWIHVNSGGVFQIGTELNRYDANDFVITLTGDNPNEIFVIEGSGTVTDNNAFLMVASGGQLQFFGKEKLTFTKLAATAEIGANQILVKEEIDRNFDGVIDLADGALDWEVGDEIVIASSSRDYDDQEVRSIDAIANQDDGTFLITLDSALNKRHYGQTETYGNGSRTWDLDLRAEVAILNRNVRIQGLASQDTDIEFGDRARYNPGTVDGFGAHTMIMGSAGQITLDSVQFDLMGQTGRLGRYPVHWHVAGDRSGDILRGASITNSNNRGVTVHGTHNLLIQDVVLHDVQGHGFFMEDGVETGNHFLSNIAFGIHKVGRSAAVGNFAPDLNDPFIVDTHDHVGQNANRFLSSSAYWITNPDNTWIGNISAGSEGTGFWFILPEFAIGASASDPQYANVDPSRTDLRQFDHNSSHSSPAGLNFDRGSDVEVSVGGTLKAFFDGDLYLPPAEPQINFFTAYKHHVGIYHRGFDANFHENRFADNFDSTFITFTQRITDSLYVGHSQGNANSSQIVTGHSLYDGANTLDGTHFAGYSASNAHTFRTHSSARRHVAHVMTNTSFENDGSANHVSITSQEGTLTSGSFFGRHNPFGHSPSAVYDADGTLTGHVGGGAGSTVVVDHPFFYDSGDIKPSGWDARISDDLYASVSVQPSNANADFTFTTPDGDAGTTDGDNFNTVVKTDDGDYVVSFPEGVNSVAAGFNFSHYIRVGPSTGATVFQFVGVGNLLAPAGVQQVSGITAVRNATNTAYAVVNGDLWLKAFSSPNSISFVPSSQNQQTLWQDDEPLSGTSGAGDSLTVNTFDGVAATGDPSRALVGDVIMNGLDKYTNINGGTFAVDPQYQGTGYTFTVDYFVPVGTTLDSLPGNQSPDTFYLQIDFNGVNSGAGGFTDNTAAGTGWNTITLSGIIPGGTTSALPLFIVADGGFGAGTPNGTGSGTAVYIDNINFTVGLQSIKSAAISSPTSVPSVIDSASIAEDPVQGQLFTSSVLLGLAQTMELTSDLTSEETQHVGQGLTLEYYPQVDNTIYRDLAFETLGDQVADISAPRSSEESESEDEGGSPKWSLLSTNISS